MNVQREKNPHLKPMTKGEFVNYIEELKLGPAEWMKDVLKANYKCAMDPSAAWIPTDVPACEIKGTMNPNAGDIVIEFIDSMVLDHDPDTILVDVRELEELFGELGHIEGVVNIPVGQLQLRLDELEEYKKRPIVTICRSGARATTAAQILILTGFENVRVLEGGMLKFSSV